PGVDAMTERVDPESYVLDLKLQARLPSPNKTIEELAKITPQLPTLLPGLTAMLSSDPVSPLFAQLYEMKVKVLRENLARLDQVLSRHNFFDCQTVLQLQHPQSHRKALLLQADMDVDADGSDADRMPIGTTDPYIGVPGAFAHGNDAPKVGDYALVVFAEAVYPAIVGDIGPNDRVGEASLRIAKQINGLSTPYNRPVSDLKVTYLVFP